jgi:hypothetical protein
MSQAREALKTAVASIAELTAQIESLEKAQLRAGEAAQEARNELQRHSNLNAEITHWRVAETKAGRSTKVLPDKLRAKQELLKRAQEELDQSQSTLEALDDEMQDLRMRLKPAEKERYRLAWEVLHEHCNGLAEELHTLNIRRWKLRQILTSLGELTIYPPGENFRRIGLTVAMERALDGFAPQFIPSLDPLRDMGARWHKRADQLLANPDAQITTPKPILPSDYSFERVPTPNDGKFHLPQSVTRLRAED